MSLAPAGTPLPLSIAGQALWLLPQRALWWPAAQTLFVADLHLGKAAAFRALGQPVPSGTTQDNLDRLSALLHHYPARRIVFLGDFLHAAAARQPQVLEPAARWRERHAAVACVLVRGNHDRHAGDPPPALGFAVVDEPWVRQAPAIEPSEAAVAALAACHHPQRVAGATVLAGHWHPAVTLRGPARDSYRLPCFCRMPGLLVLPAFGAFTGGTQQPLPPDAQLYPVGADRVWALPVPAGAPGGRGQRR